MKFRAGLVTGFAAGFYLGTMAGRERYHQMNRLIRRARRSDMVTGRAKAVAGMSGARLAPAGPPV